MNFNRYHFRVGLNAYPGNRLQIQALMSAVINFVMDALGDVDLSKEPLQDLKMVYPSKRDDWAGVGDIH